MLVRIFLVTLNAGKIYIKILTVYNSNYINNLTNSLTRKVKKMSKAQ